MKCKKTVDASKMEQCNTCATSRIKYSVTQYPKIKPKIVNNTSIRRGSLKK